jgi:glucans biosynthesis protein C
MPDMTKPIRYHSLDALRAFALLLGIVFHAAESFCPGRKSWAIIDSRAHDAFDLFQHVCHSFRMEIFFLIAGFFAHMLLQKIGTRAFVAHRVRRILVPLAVGWLFLYPMFMLIWIWGKSVSGSLGDLGIPQQLQHLGVFQLAAGVIVTGAFLRDAFSLIHLWFLYYLLLLYAGALVIRVTAARFATAIDRVFGWICRTRYRLVFFALATIPLIAKMHGGVDTPNRSLIPNLTVLALYGVFFATGWFLHRQPELLSEVTRGWGFYLAAGAAAILITVYGRGILNGVFPGGISKSWMLAYRSTLYGMMMWSFVLGITGAFTTLFRRESPVWRYIADSSYWLYMVHHIVVVPMQILVASLDISAVIKYALINAVTFPVLFASYHFLVRPTFIGAALNGRRYPRHLPWHPAAPAPVFGAASRIECGPAQAPVTDTARSSS